MVMKLSSGHSASYLTDAVAAGRENYYTGAVAAGEPPGRWSGRGAERLGLSGEVDAQDMTALYERFIDPRDENFRNPEAWNEAATLGHTGRSYLSAEAIYAAALEGEPGADEERRAALLLEAGKKARRNVAFYDATFSVQKSITVLHTAFDAQAVHALKAAERARSALDALTGAAGAGTGAPVQPGAPGAVHTAEARRLIEAERAALAEADHWATHRQAVEDAIWAGNQAGLDHLSEKAGYTRVGHHGGAAGRWADAHDWTVASFFQHDSRDHDPQLHIHNAILNRVENADGKWRTLDGQSLTRHHHAAGALAHRVMEQHLTRALGLEFRMRPDGKSREIVGIDQAVMDLFSSRRKAITPKIAELVAAFEARFQREPNPLERSRLQQQATLLTRRVKSHTGESVDQRLERWDRQLRAEVAGGLQQLANDVLSRRGAAVEPQRWSARDVVEKALAAAQEKKAAWTVADLTHAVSDALPDHLGRMRPERITTTIEKLTAKALRQATPLAAAQPGAGALPGELRRADGSSAYEKPGGALYATPTHLRSERVLAGAGYELGAPTLDDVETARFTARLAEAGVELSADQSAAVSGVLASGAMVETLIGPAGTGKSFVVGAIAQAWSDPDLWSGTQRRVVGLAASQIATEVLTDEGLTARNITRWLDTQQRLADGESVEEDRAWTLRAGDLVVVDESAMANTADLARIHGRCRAAGAKLLLVGDHRQLAAVGAAGGMELVAAAAPRHELCETRRFRADWEGPASLRLRDHDETVLADYHKHGRLIDGGAIEQTEATAAKAWLADHLAGKDALLIVDTNEQAARVSAMIRADLVRLGRVTENGVLLAAQGTIAGPGDLVVARRNQWTLARYAGNRRAPINRETYRVLATRDDGGLVVRAVRKGRDVPGDALTLPGQYVAEHLTLAYASTVNAAQGRTVDVCHTVAGASTGAEALYVGISRGKDGNYAYVVTRSVSGSDQAPTGAALQAVHRSPQAVLAGVFETTDPQLSALAEATRAAEEAESVRTPAELFADAAQLATAGRTARWLDELAEIGALTESDRMALAVEDGANTLALLLRRAELAGHDPKQVLTDAIARRGFDDARQITNVLHRRITETVELDPVGESYAEWVPQVDDPEWSTYLTTLAQAADERSAELGTRTADEAPQWAVEALGPVPDEDARDRNTWVENAGRVAAHRELVGHNDADDALGAAPKPGQVEAYASWRAAWRALGRPDADRAEAEMSSGQLRVRIRAYDREKTWAPPYVAEELAATRQAADRHRRDSALRAAEAEAAPTVEEARRLDREGVQSAALAATLDAQAAELDQADLARAEWYGHTAETRAAAERASAELSARDASREPDADDELVTAEEWLAAQEAAERAEDPHRQVTAAHELIDVEDERDHDQRAAGAHVDDGDAATTVDGETEPASEAEPVETRRTPAVDEPGPTPVDIRSEAADEPTGGSGAPGRAAASADPAPARSEAGRVPSADETADAVRRAQRALHELRQRQQVEERRAADERDDQAARWHAEDTGHDTGDAARDTDGAADWPSTPSPAARTRESGPVLEASAFDD